jgi:HTH-type transcriptional regulator / antitoxin HipB
MHTITHVTQVGASLQGRRKALKLSQAEVASRLGLSQNRLSELENHPQTMTVEQLLALLNVLGLEMALGDRRAGSARSEW